MHEHSSACDHDHDHGHEPPAAREGRWALVLQALFLVAAVGFLAMPADMRSALADLPLNFVSIVLEAIPFMMVGALAGGVIEVFDIDFEYPRDITDESFMRIKARILERFKESIKS